MMYGFEFDINLEIMGKNFLIPIGKAKIEHQGINMTNTAHA